MYQSVTRKHQGLELERLIVIPLFANHFAFTVVATIDMVAFRVGIVAFAVQTTTVEIEAEPQSCEGYTQHNEYKNYYIHRNNRLFEPQM